MEKKFVKFVLVIPALAGLFLMASVPNFSTKANGENFWYMTEDEVTIDKIVHDFESVSESGEPVEATFTITNNSKAPILLTNVSATCGCTTPEWTKEPIEAGKTGKVTATFNPKGTSGPINKTVTILTSGNPNRFSVRLTGTVEKD